MLTSFRCFRLVEAAFACRVRTLGVQVQVAEVAAERVSCRYQAERAAVAAYLSGKQTGVQRSTPGGGGKHKDADVGEDNLGEFGFPGFSLEEGDLTGALVQRHGDAIVAEKLFPGRGAAPLLGDPAKHRPQMTVSPPQPDPSAHFQIRFVW